MLVRKTFTDTVTVLKSEMIESFFLMNPNPNIIRK